MPVITPEGANYLKALALFFAVLAATGLLLEALHAGQYTFDLIMGQLGLLGATLLFCMGKAKDFRQDFRKIRPPVVAGCIVTGFMVSFTTIWYRHVALKHDLIVTPGTRQVNAAGLAATPVDFVIIATAAVLLGPVLEELAFRYVGLGLAYRVIAQHTSPGSARIMLVFWVTATSIIFALLHGPGFASFPVYFLSSIVFSISYLKYGLFAAVLAHASTNAGALIWLMINLPRVY